MARTNNPVFQVLVTKEGVLPLIAPGQAITALLPGQIGIFNQNSNLTVNPLDVTTMRNIYIAVGKDVNGNGVSDDVMKSTGEYIQARNFHWVSVQCPKDCAGPVYQITPQNIFGDTEYFMRFEFITPRLMERDGRNYPTKTFVAKSKCCESTSTCACDDNTVCVYLMRDLVREINNDNEGVLDAWLWDVDNGVEIADADVDTWLADPANAGNCLSMRVTSICEGLQVGMNQILKYNKQRAFHFTVAFGSQPQGGSFISNGDITLISGTTQAEGKGYDIQYVEYQAGGHNGKPGLYRQSEALGSFMPSMLDVNAVRNSEYIQLVLGHDSVSIVGFQEPLNDMETIICVPCEDLDTTLAWLVDMLERYIFPANNVNIDINVPLDCCVGDDSPSS